MALGCILLALLAIIRPMPVIAFEHQFIKGFGALNVTFLVVAGVLLIARRFLPRVIVDDTPAEAPVPALPEPTSGQVPHSV